jgi:uncharacterized protein (DUF1778 family)
MLVLRLLGKPEEELGVPGAHAASAIDPDPQCRDAVPMAKKQGSGSRAPPRRGLAPGLAATPSPRQAWRRAALAPYLGCPMSKWTNDEEAEIQAHRGAGPAGHDLVQRAAELQGSSLSKFVVCAAEKQARRTLEDASTIRLSVEDQRRFVELLLNPPEPTPALERARAAHEWLIGPV